MLTSDEIRRVDKYSPASSTSRIGSYLWSWVSPTKPLVRLPGGGGGGGGGVRFVLVELVAAAAHELAATLQQHAAQAGGADVFTLEQLAELSGRPAQDVLLLAEHLRLEGHTPLTEAFPSPASGARVDGGILLGGGGGGGGGGSSASTASASTRVFKFGSKDATPVDHSRALLAAAIRSLRLHATNKEAYIAARENEARRLLKDKRKPLALMQLQMKRREKPHTHTLARMPRHLSTARRSCSPSLVSAMCSGCVQQLHALHSQVDNLDLVLSHLEQSESQQQFLACITKANQTLKQAQRSAEAECTK